jgi:hypothetical protein
MSAYAVVLLAYAQVVATLTGFIEVVFVFAERARRLDGDLSSALFHLMFASLGALFLSLFAALLLVYSVAEEHIARQICNALSGFIHLLGAGRLIFETLGQKTEVRRSSVYQHAWPREPLV